MAGLVPAIHALMVHPTSVTAPYTSASGFSSSRNSARNDAKSVAAIARKTVVKVATDAPPRKLWLNVPACAPTGALASMIAPNSRS